MMAGTRSGARSSVAVVLLLTLAACSGGSTDPSGAESTPTTVSDTPSSSRSSTSFGPLPTSERDATTTSKFQEVLDAAVASGYPDAIAAVLTPQGAWTGAAGVDGPKGRQATPDDVFAIASITKTFTSALIMRLAEQGKIDLDRPLSTYLGSLQVDTNGATVRQALAMQSGIPDTAADSVAKILAEPNRVWTKDDVVAEFPKPETAPGVGFIYSNPTYKMLGMAAEEVTGSSLPAVMRAEVLDPAGSPKTLLMQSAETPTPKPWALPLTSSGLDVADFGTGGALPSISDATFSLAGSAMASDAQSLASWAWQLFAGKVVSQESLTTMMTVDPDGKGLGLDKMTDFGSTTAFGHTGSKDGYQSQFFVFPDRQVVIAVFVNQGDVDLATIASQLLDASGS